MLFFSNVKQFELIPFRTGMFDETSFTTKRKITEPPLPLRGRLGIPLPIKGKSPIHFTTKNVPLRQGFPQGATKRKVMEPLLLRGKS
ncbi:hypothetical protein CEXT_539181 [Caerostris extrusa]|uniref:Uncharacterized protein n=1 Tax=Caerostris extrusa TaxID=172846 RepID=A0AAV4WMH3_CAEEX|nr:hypothetical protein CEXT_539181 [Caerostris extrusa]